MTSPRRFFPIVESVPREHDAPTPLDREEARRLCQVTLAGAPARARSLLVEVDARGAHLIAAAGAEPIVIWTVCRDGLDDDRAIADALARARLGFLRGWLSRGLVILGGPHPLAERRRQTSVLRALTECLGLAVCDATTIVPAQAA